MPNRIKADSASGLQLISDSSDEIQIQSGTDTVATINSSGITMGSGKNLVTNAPAFSALFGTDQSFSTTTWTKIQYNTEDFDTNSNYDNSTNYRFTPTVAGYYQVNANIRLNYSGSAGDGTYLALYKNGSAWNVTSRLNVTSLYGSLSLSSLVYLNGSTDYIEMYGYTNHGSPFFDQNSAVPSRFSAFLARAV